MSRTWGLVLLALALAPMGSAAGTAVLDDAANDVDLVVNDVRQGIDPLSASAAMDLTRLEINETAETLTFGIVLNPEDGSPERSDRADFWIGFAVGHVHYQVHLWANNGRWDVFLDRLEGNVVVESVIGPKELQAHVIDNPPALQFPLPRDLLRDEFGAPARKGTALANFTVEATQWSNGNTLAYGYADEMPDGLAPTGRLELALGEARQGPIELTSGHPFHASNGGARTYPIVADLTSLEGEQRFRLTATSPKDGHVVLFPREVTVAAGRTTPITAILTTTSTHEHGTDDSFVVTATSADDPDIWAEARLGVHYLDVPQPAGHHPDVHLHARGQGSPIPLDTGPGALNIGTLYFNTVSEDPNDDAVPVGGSPTEAPDGAPVAFSWLTDLTPTLRIGVAVDPEKETSASIPLGVPGGLTDATLHVDVVATGSGGGDQHKVIVASGKTPGLQFPADGAPARVEVPLHADEEAVLYPQAEMRMLALIVVEGTRLPDDGATSQRLAPSIHAGGTIGLPLRDLLIEPPNPWYAAQGVTLALQTPDVRSVNAGEAVVFEGAFGLPTMDRVVFTLDGPDMDHVSLLTPTLQEPRGNEATFAIGMEIPSESTSGQQSQASLAMMDAETGTVLGVARFLATVDESIDTPDEASIIDQYGKASGQLAPLSWFLVPMVLVGAGRLRRGRPSGRRNHDQ